MRRLLALHNKQEAFVVHGMTSDEAAIPDCSRSLSSGARDPLARNDGFAV
ncbi:MAG TPA: hypothetical protein VHB49_19345 [Bradyrhizobium sp.]|nr:hypothetical protein [Bradyrhizobium sp.]